MTSLNDELSLFDRGTLVFWRVSNLIGWSVLAMLAGYTLNFLLFNLNLLAWQKWTSSFGGGSDLIPTVIGPLSSVVAGAVVGSVVGRHLYRFVMPIATAIGGVQGLMWGDLLEAWYGGRPVRIVLGSTAALIAARVAWGRLPMALRGGRGPR
jgi:hypothetical protein